MIEEKINYYITRINNLKKDLEFENEKIFEYENLLIKEKKDYNDLSFFGRCFSKNNHINLIEKLLKEHTFKSINLEKEIKITIDEFIENGSKDSVFYKLEEENKIINKKLLEEKSYLNTIYASISNITKLFNENHIRLNQISLSTNYDSMDDYKRISSSFSKVYSKIKSLQTLIFSYKIFDSYFEKINFSMDEILRSLSILEKLEKVKELKNKGHFFEPVKINLDILLSLLENIEKSIDKEILENSIKEENLIIDNQILFINDLLSKYNFDITNH